MSKKRFDYENAISNLAITFSLLQVQSNVFQQSLNNLDVESVPFVSILHLSYRRVLQHSSQTFAHIDLSGFFCVMYKQ